MHIHEMNMVNEEVIKAFRTLIPQLNQNNPPPTMEALTAMAASDMTFVFLAREANDMERIIGTATLGIYQTPTGFHGWIEDVVVDRDARRRGIGQALTEACLEKAHQLGLNEVNLTSRPSRQAANQLYQVMGFEQRETNVYRFSLG